MFFTNKMKKYVNMYILSKNKITYFYNLITFIDLFINFIKFNKIEILKISVFLITAFFMYFYFL
jgi:hypothetical protein